MRFQSRTRHAVQALFDMAFHCRGAQAQAREIAERQLVPLRTLEEVLQELRRAGLVQGHRGPRGGYVLARAPESITVGDVVRAMEGEATAGTAGGATDDDRFGPLWAEVGMRVSAVLSEMTLQDFVTRAERAGMKRATSQPQMYFI